MRRVLLIAVCLVSLSAPPVWAQNPAADFSKQFAVWSDLLKQLETFQTQYKSAKPEQRPAIREQFEKLLKDGEAMQPKLRAAAEAAYKAEPNKSEDVSHLLVSLIFADSRRDDHAGVLAGSEVLINGKYENARVYNLAGVAALQLGDLDKAEKYLKEADAKNALSPEGRNMLDGLADTKAKWKVEQEKRAAEAKADDLPRIEMVTNKGKMVIELFENEAPNTVANFVSLVDGKKYDGLTFHRVLPGFMAQGGDPLGNGTGGPGYSIACECNQENHRNHFLGTLSMAHSGPNTGGSQFFITFGRTAHLDGKHTAFGRVVEGFDVLTKLQRRDPGDPKAPAADKIVTAKVLRKREHEYKPKTTPDKK